MCNKHRLMNVNILSDKSKYNFLGNDCHIVKKTGKTRLGMEFIETIQCQDFKIKKAKK